MTKKILPFLLFSTLTLSCRDLIHADNATCNEAANCAQEVVAPTTRFQPVLFEVKTGYSYPTKWNASFVIMAVDRNVRLGVFILGPYDNYIATNELSKTNITTWGISAGWGDTRWHSKSKGSGFDFFFGSGNTDKNTENIPWNYGFQINGNYSVYTDRKGGYALALATQLRRMYVVSNKDKHGVAYDSSQKGSWIASIGIALSL